jgi:hypothetical protein
MSFDQYWKTLVQRVANQREVLQGDEDAFYRLSCIVGETMVGGLAAYFDNRWMEFDADMQALEASGFSDVAVNFRAARELIFGDALLDADVVYDGVAKLFDESDEAQPMIAKVDAVNDELIPRFKDVGDARDRIGIANGFYEQ